MQQTDTLTADSYEELMHFVEKHPICYYIMRSAIFIQVLKSLQNTKDLIRLRMAFPHVEMQDLEQILELLLKAGVISHFRAGSKDFYYTNQVGKKFLELYEKTKTKLFGKTSEDAQQI